MGNNGYLYIGSFFLQYITPTHIFHVCHNALFHSQTLVIMGKEIVRRLPDGDSDYDGEEDTDEPDDFEDTLRRLLSE